MDRTRAHPCDLQATVEIAVDGLMQEWVSEAQAARVASILRGFARFCAKAYDISDPVDVTQMISEAYIHAPDTSGKGPSLSLVHLRRGALRLLFRSARRLGHEVGDPTLDVVLPPRDQVRTRPLTDEEISLCRASSAWSLKRRTSGGGLGAGRGHLPVGGARPDHSS